MKNVCGKGKLFFDDVEIENISSFSINALAEEFPATEQITFTGIFDPIDIPFAISNNVITGRVHGVNGESKEMLLKVSFMNDKTITLEPVNEKDKEWVKEHLFNIIK